MSKSASFLSKHYNEVPQSMYEIDMALHDRYQAFSAELLKLSLAGMGVVGFFLTLIAGDKTSSFKDLLDDCYFRTFCTISLTSLALAVAAALCHRFLASEGMYHHVRAIRLMIVSKHSDLDNEHTAEKKSIEEEMLKDERIRNRKFNRAGICLGLSGCFLAIGTGFLGAAFTVLLLF